MTSAERAAAKAKKRNKWRDDRAYLRINDPKFVEKEQAAHKRYADFRKLAMAFARHFPEQFEQFKRTVVQQSRKASLQGRSVASQPIQAARHMPATTAPHMPATTSATNENGRPKPPAAVDLIDLLGLARD